MTSTDVILLVALLSHGPATPRESSRVHSDPSRATLVRGQVIDDLVGPLSNAIVELEVAGSHALMRDRSDDRGNFVLRVGEPLACSGTLRVRVRHIGFRPATMTLPCSALPAVVNLQLAPLPPVWLE